MAEVPDISGVQGDPTFSDVSVAGSSNSISQSDSERTDHGSMGFSEESGGHLPPQPNLPKAKWDILMLTDYVSSGQWRPEHMSDEHDIFCLNTLFQADRWYEQAFVDGTVASFALHLEPMEGEFRRWVKTFCDPNGSAGFRQEKYTPPSILLEEFGSMEDVRVCQLRKNETLYAVLKLTPEVMYRHRAPGRPPVRVKQLTFTWELYQDQL